MKKDKINKGFLVRAFCGLGAVYNLIGRYKDALQAYKKAEMLVYDRRSKIEALIGQATIYENLAEYDSMINLLNRLIKLSRSTLSEVYVLSRYCWVYRLQGRMGKSNSAGNRGMELLKRLKKRGLSQIELYHVEGAIVNAIGTLYLSQGDFDKAIELYQRFLKVSEESRNLFGIGMAANNQGSVYTHKGDYDKAIPLFKKKLAISEKLGNKVGIAMAVNNLGWIYGEKKNFDRAIELYERALSIAEELDNKFGILNVIINLGNLHKSKVNYNRAFALFRKAMTIAKRIGDKQAIGAVYLGFGEIYNELNELHKSTEYLERARAIFEELGDKTYLSSTILVLIEVGIKEIEENGVDKNRRRLKKIYEYIDENLKLADEMKSGKERPGVLFLHARLASLDEKWDKESVKEKFVKSIKMFKELNMTDELGKAYYFYAIYLKKIDEFEIANKFLAEARKIFKKIGDINYLNKIDEL
ncbi:MAG: tetratricopeptide repeat protein [bacterium]